MAYTRSDLITQVLGHLGVLASGETATATDAADVGRVIDSVYGILTDEGLTTGWTLAAIPDSVLLPMRDLVAYHCRRMYGLAGEVLADVARGEAVALRQLRRRAAGAPGLDAPVTTEYF